MVVKLHLFAVSACVLTLALVSKANAFWENHHNQCRKFPFGTLFGRHIELPTQYLPPYQRDVIIHIPVVCAIVNGYLVTVCDDGRPLVQLLGPNTLLVHRTGNIDEMETVDITVFCGAWDSEASSKLVPIAHPVASKQRSKFVDLCLSKE